MTEKEKLEQLAYDDDVPVDYLDFTGDRLCGLYIDGSIAIKNGMGINKTTDILAEELGHHYTTVGNILNQTDESNRKQELKARLWAYNKRVGLNGIIRAYQHRCFDRHEFAEFLEVTEEFLQDAIDCYHQKYGLTAEVDNYIIVFEPALAVMEKF